MLQIKDIFKLNSLRRAKLLAAKDHNDNIIKRVNIMDAPDISDWINENELLLTSGFAIYKNIEDMNEMIKSLADSNCAGLGIKLNRFFNKIPNSIIEFGEEFGLPIIEIPKDINLGDIVEEILIEISMKYEFDEINIVPMLNECLQSQNIEEVIRLVGEILNKNIYLESALFDEPLTYLFDLKLDEWNKVYNSNDDFLKNSDSLNYNIYEIKENIKGYKYKLEFKIKYDNYNLARLIIINEKSEINNSEKKAVIQFCQNILIFLLNKKRLMLENNHDLENKIIYNILEKENKEKLIEQLNILDININLEKTFFQLIVIDILENKEEQKENIDERLEKIIDNLKNKIDDKKNKDMLIGVYKSKIVTIFMNVQKDKNKTKINTFVKFINDFYKNYFPERKTLIGISKNRQEFSNIKNLYFQALKALDIAKERKSNIFKFQDIGFLGDIYNLDQNRSLEKIAKSNLEAILNHENCYEYIQTLEKYFQNDEKAQKAAEELNIHRNTLKYRLDKIQELTNKNINNLDDKFKLYIGIKAYNLLK